MPLPFGVQIVSNTGLRLFVFASTHLYKSVFPSVGPWVYQSVGLLVRNPVFFDVS